MFDFVHEKRRFVQIVLVLIVLPFAFFGVASYRHAGDSNGPASVNGVDISQQAFDTALRQQQDRMRQMLGANFDPAMFDNSAMKRAVLDNLIAQRVLLDRARAVGLTVTDQQMAEVIAGIDAFKVDGKFDNKRYARALANQNMSPLMFEARVKDDLVGQQLRDAYKLNGYAANRVAKNIIALNEQQRMVSVVKVVPDTFMSQAKVDDVEIKTYYDQHQKEFKVPEKIKVAYVVLSIKGLMSKADVKTEEAKQYYEGHLTEFTLPEQRQASHILLTVADTAPQAEQDAVKARALDLLKQVKQNPSKFAELAKKYSQDPGSAVQGGDLGLFARGMMVKSFDDAVFALKMGEISGLVKSSFGYHIIKLTKIKSAKASPYSEVAAEILNKLRKQKAADNFAELADKFSNTVYEQSDTLEAAAKLAGVKIQDSAWLNKGVTSGDIWTAKMLEAVFSDDVIHNKRNTAAIEVSADTLVSARMLEHKAAAVRDFSEVANTIKQKILRKKALDMAVKQGTMLLGQLQKGEKPALSWSVSQTITHAKHGALDVTMVRKLFQSDSAKLPQYVGAESKQGGYILVRVDAIKNAAQPDDVKVARYAQQLRKMTGDEMFQAYLEEARKHEKIKVKLPAKVAP